MVRFKIIFFFIFIIFAVYLINYPLGIIPIPEGMSQFDPWIIGIGGVLLLIGGIDHLRANRRLTVF